MRRAGSDRLVVAESLLREGSSYSEDDLRLAVYRIKRLPFILDAEFTLRRGSERGRFELLIGVEEVKPYFLQYFADYELSERPGGFGSFRERLVDDGIVGARYFVNSHDLAFAAWNPDGFVNLGYTRFNLFGRGGYASLQASAQSELHDRNLSLTAAVPIAGNHAVRSTTSWFESDASSAWGQSLEWLYTTTDDPLLPSEGEESAFNAAYQSGRLKRVLRDDDTVGPLTQRAVGLSARGRKHWPLTLRQSASLGGNAYYSRHRADRESFGIPAGVERKTYGGGVDVGYAVSLLRTRGVGPRRDLRFESGLFYADQRFDSTFFLDRSRSWGANLGLVFRNAWSLIRLSFRYSRLIGDER
jgi:outer membrane protein assembly factor BamA